MKNCLFTLVANTEISNRAGLHMLEAQMDLVECARALGAIFEGKNHSIGT